MKRIMLNAAGAIAALGLCGGVAGAESFSGNRTGSLVGVPSAGPMNGGARLCAGRDCRRQVQDGALLNWYGGEWAQYNNRSWEPSSYNDWWHDDPSRSFPRWMQNNQGCARLWYAADTLRC